MSAKSFQRLFGENPDNKNQNLAMYLKCKHCNTKRIYKIDDALSSVQNRSMSGLEIEVQCEKCGGLITAGLCWIEMKIGYSYNELPKETKGHCMEITDENGLFEKLDEVK